MRRRGDESQSGEVCFVPLVGHSLAEVCSCGDGLEGEDDAVVGVEATVLPAIEGRGEELVGGAIGLGDGGGEATVADTDGVINGVALQDLKTCPLNVKLT